MQTYSQLHTCLLAPKHTPPGAHTLLSHAHLYERLAYTNIHTNHQVHLAYIQTHNLRTHYMGGMTTLGGDGRFAMQ